MTKKDPNFPQKKIYRSRYTSGGASIIIGLATKADNFCEYVYDIVVIKNLELGRSYCTVLSFHNDHIDTSINRAPNDIVR